MNELGRQIVLHYDHEDGVWWAEVPSLPGCYSQGDTREQLLENVREAIELWIEGAQEIGRDIPEERFGAEVRVV